MKNKGVTSSSLSRVPVWIQAHTKKSGEPINTTAAETIDKLKQVELDDPVSSSVLKEKEDALSKILGRENQGRIRGLGKGVTLTKLCVLSQRDSYKTQEKEEASQLKERVAHLESLVTHLMKNENQASEEGPTITKVSPSSQNTNTPNKKCKLLDWIGSGEVVAEGRWSSSDPKQLVHHIPIGPNAMRVWVDLAREAGAYLWRPTADMTYIEDAVGTTVAWPADKVVMGQ
ncbi:uncharacterized protein LOC114286908 [Camellia sinensis]|uniref:uncharacterized protein LOC114286908 n=1 Tax=Camellia sinensis TaxID=4442 RepID=UPI001035D449|nr:uncharacterized protein LOC114286908 [Camellia sinensis]